MRCRCKSDCEAEALGPSGYARGHNPASQIRFLNGESSNLLKSLWKKKDFRKKVMSSRQDMYASSEWRRKVGEVHIGKRSWNAGLTKEDHPSIRSIAAHTKKRWAGSGREKMMAGLEKCYNDQNWIKKVTPKGAYYGKGATKIWMRSEWEVAFANWLDKKGIDWKYEPKIFRFSGMTYRPDFLLTASKYWVEIKGFLTEEAREKIIKFCLAFRPRFILLKHRELKALGVI